MPADPGATPNLAFDRHPLPCRQGTLQIGRAGFLQLPLVLPSGWPAGRVEGLRARGCYVIALDCRDLRVVRARVQSRLGRPRSVRYAGLEMVLKLAAGGLLGWTPKFLIELEHEQRCETAFGVASHVG